MKKSSLLLFLFLMFSTFCFAQSITLKGVVTDDTNYPLESATVYLTSVKDSTVVDYTITKKNGSWEMKTRKIDEPVYLKISFIGMASYTKRFEILKADDDFGTIVLKDNATELSEVVIKGEVPPIRIKSDTLEFNASSFKVRPDANVKELLKQLPGVEIDDEGKITVNGKEVNQILVNGKPFFDKDGKIALQNLPSEIINKVQVTDTKTKEEELSGEKASGNNASINLTIDEDKNKGVFGKAMAGYGSDDRYESSLLFNYFKDKQRFSVLASSNNINSTGFSMDEIFDNMRGGRNSNIYYSGNGSFNINGVQFGGGSGITRSNMVGISFSDTWFKKLEPNINYFYTSANNENENRTRMELFLPDDGTGVDKKNITNSISKSESDQYAHNVNTQFEYKIDSTSTINYSPRFTKNNSKNRNTSSQTTFNQDDILINESAGTTFSETDTDNFESNLDYHKAFRHKGRGISLSLSNENNKSEGANYNQSETYFYEDGNTTSDIRNQVRYNRRAVDNYRLKARYSEPVTDSLKLIINTEYTSNQQIEDREGFDFDNATGDFSIANDALTNYLSSKTNTVTPSAGISINKSKYYFSFEAGTSISQFDNFSSYMGTDYSLNKTYIYPTANFYGNYRLSQSKYLYANYSYDVWFPQASQVLPVEDLSNALYTTTGNPDLDPNKYHNFYLSFGDYDYSTRTGYNIYASANLTTSDIVNNTTIAPTGKTTTTYTNVSGVYNSWLGGSFSKLFKKDEHSFRVNIGVSGGLDKGKGYTNGEQYQSDTYRIAPKIAVNYDFGELLNISPSYKYTYRKTDYTNFNIGSQSNFTHVVNLQTTSYWPKHFVFGNDFGYTYNSQLSDGFKKDFFLWNASLGYNFYNDQLLFKVKVYDILNQNLGTSRTISSNSIYDQQNTVLKRYVMFSLTYKIKKFGGKETKSRGNSFWMF